MLINYGMFSVVGKDNLTPFILNLLLLGLSATLTYQVVCLLKGKKPDIYRSVIFYFISSASIFLLLFVISWYALFSGPITGIIVLIFSGIVILKRNKNK